MARKISDFIDCWQISRSDVLYKGNRVPRSLIFPPPVRWETWERDWYKGSQQKAPLWDFRTSSFKLILIALNQIWGSNFKSLNVSYSHLKHLKCRSRNLKSQNVSNLVPRVFSLSGQGPGNEVENVSGSQRKTLFSHSHKYLSPHLFCLTTKLVKSVHFPTVRGNYPVYMTCAYS